MPTGGQLRAMLNNDLRECFGRADVHRREVVFPILVHLWNNIPAGAWGSEDKVNAWMALDNATRARHLGRDVDPVRDPVGPDTSNPATPS